MHFIICSPMAKLHKMHSILSAACKRNIEPTFTSSIIHKLMANLGIRNTSLCIERIMILLDKKISIMIIVFLPIIKNTKKRRNLFITISEINHVFIIAYSQEAIKEIIKKIRRIDNTKNLKLPVDKNFDIKFIKSPGICVYSIFDWNLVEILWKIRVINFQLIFKIRKLMKHLISKLLDVSLNEILELMDNGIHLIRVNMLTI